MGKPNFYTEEKELGCCTQFGRFLLLFMNFVFILGSIAGIVVSIIMLAKKDDSYLEFCHVCKKFNYVTIAACGALLLFSFLGLRALWKRNTCTLIIYGIYLVVFFMMALAIGIVIIMVHLNKFDKELKQVWEDEVKAEPQTSCDFMIKAECSGWDTLCNNTEIFANLTETIVATTQCPPCLNAQAMTVANMTITCRDKLHNEVDRYYKPLIGVTFSLVGLTVLSLLVTCNLRKEFQEYEELGQNYV